MKPTRSKTDSYRSRFGLTHHPLPRDASGRTFFDQTAGYQRLEMCFQDLVDEPGLGVLTAEAGVGKTRPSATSARSCPSPTSRPSTCATPRSRPSTLPHPRPRAGLKPSHRRAQLWWDLKRTITHLVEQQHTLPVLILDEAQLVSDAFLVDLCGFLNSPSTGKSLLTVCSSPAAALGSPAHAAPRPARVAHRRRVRSSPRA